MTEPSESTTSPGAVFAASLRSALDGPAARRTALDRLFQPPDEQPPPEPAEPAPAYPADELARALFRPNLAADLFGATEGDETN